MTTMQMKLELVLVPVSDVDRAKAFYTENFGFHADHDQQVREDLRFVQLTPPGSASRPSRIFFLTSWAAALMSCIFLRTRVPAALLPPEALATSSSTSWITRPIS